MEENNVMQQTTDLAQMTAAINDIVPAGANVTIDIPEQPNGPTTFTQNYIPSTSNKAAAFAAGAGAAAAAVGAVIGIRFLIKKHKAKKAAAQQTTTTPQDEEEFIEV